MKIKSFGLAVIPLLFGLLVSYDNLYASPFYEGKTVRIVCGSLPGGGTDRMSRLMAKYMPKYIPGKPTIIVENVPGAGSLIAANNLYNLEKPNGLVFGTFNQALPFAQLLKATGVRFDLTKYAWIGAAQPEPALLSIRSDTPYKSVGDLRKAKDPIPVATSGPQAMNYQFPLLLQEFGKLNFKLITYPSITEGLLALERKEADCQAGTVSSLAPSMKKGLVRLLIRGRGRMIPKGFENLPLDEDLSTDARGKILMALRSSADEIARAFVAPPKTPLEKMTILRNAFANSLKDSEFLAEVNKFGMTTEYVSADECLRVINFIFSQSEDIVRDFSKFIKF